LVRIILTDLSEAFFSVGRCASLILPVEGLMMNTQTLTWLHTRKGTSMRMTGTYGQLMLRVMMVRHVHPNHPMKIDGVPV
jgi:hypothetical protein